MIVKEDGLFCLYCDICGGNAEELFYDFQDAVKFKKEQGWTSQKYKGEWEDICPECKE